MKPIEPNEGNKGAFARFWKWVEAPIGELRYGDAVVAIVSEDPSEWILFEIGLAQDAGVPVILVMEGSGSPPVPLSKLPTVHIAASSSTTALKVPPDLHSEIQRAVKKRKR